MMPCDHKREIFGAFGKKDFKGQRGVWARVRPDSRHVIYGSGTAQLGHVDTRLTAIK